MSVLVLRAAGTNCDRETAYAFERVGLRVETRHVNELLAEPELLHNYRILAIPGGFSYGDDVAAGRVLAVELKRRVVPEITKFVEEDGGLVLGICNGFQVLVKTGLLPGPSDVGQRVTLTHNESHRYQCEWVELDVPDDRCVFVKKGERYTFPIAHAEGRFIAPETTYNALRDEGQIVFTYRENPNGSTGDIAGICDATGRILGLMPHPERNLEPWHHPSWTRTGLSEEPCGLRLFQNAATAVA